MRFGQKHVDPRVLEIDHHGGQYQRSALIAAYHRRVLKECVKIAKLSPGMSVLDYGCGGQELKKLLPQGVRYTGYDLVPEFSDIADPTDGTYDVVFAIQMMQYPDRAGQEELAALFARLAGTLVVMLPSQNMFKRHILDPIFGLKKDADETFRAEPRDVYDVLNGKFEQVKFKLLFALAEISRWKRRP